MAVSTGRVDSAAAVATGTACGLRDVSVTPSGGPRLAVRLGDGPLRPFLLVHGLAANARVWDAVARHLLAAGHAVAAVDLRGHGRSEAPPDGYDTDTAADDLAGVLDELGYTGGREPIAVGQSWGGNVVVSLAARRAGVAAICGVDGGWIRLGGRFDSFESCWQQLAPPPLGEVTYAQVATRLPQLHPTWPAEVVAGVLAGLRELPDGGVAATLAREHHRAILSSLYAEDPRAWYPLVQVPVLLCAAMPPQAPVGEPDPGDPGLATRRGVAEALAGLPGARVSWYVDAEPDLHAEHPARLTADLLQLAAAAEAAPTGSHFAERPTPAGTVAGTLRR